MHKLSLSVQYALDASGLPTRSQFRRWVKAAALCDLQVVLRIVDEAEGRDLNRDFRGKDYATNVLTFAYDEAVPQQPLCGDIAICAPVLEREAREQGKDLVAHYAHMTIHAVLHLQGFEHDDDSSAAGMEARETAILLKLGYAAPY